MPDNECETLFLNANETASIRPLRVITQYTNTDVNTMQSPGRPTTLGVGEFKSLRTMDSIPEDGNGSQWSVKSVDNVELDRLLCHLGNNSTPVTPTSFLNPRNITEDQELFADNFSRTLNKLKAEQEGWIPGVTATANDGNTGVDGSIDDNNNSVLVVITTNSADSPVSKSFVTDSIGYAVPHSPTITRIPPREETCKIPGTSAQCEMRVNTPSRHTDISSPPRATDPSLQSPPVTLGTFGRSPRTSTMPPTASPVTSGILSSEPMFTWSASRQLMTSQDCGTTPDNTPPVSGLPTILSIATSLKEACAERRVSQTSNTDYGGSPGFLGSFHRSSILSPYSQGSADLGRTQMAVCYAFSDPSPPSIQSASSCNEGLLTSLVSAPSSEASLRSVTTDTVPNFDVRSSLGGLYTLVRPDQCVGTDATPVSAAMSLGAVEPSTVTTNSLGVLSSSMLSECSSLLNSKTPLTLLVSGAPTSDYSSELAKDQTPGTHGLDAPATTRLSSGTTVSLVQDMTTGALLLKPEPQLQQLSTLYPGLNGAFALNTNGTSSRLMSGVTSFVLQPSPEMNVSSLNFLSALPCNSSGEAALLNAQSLDALRSAGLLQNGLEQLTRPITHCDQTQVVGGVSVPSQLNTTSVPAYYSSAPVPSVPVISHNQKKTKRPPSSSSNRRNRNELGPPSLSAGLTTSAVVCADSSTGSPRGTKTGSKRSRSSGCPLGRQGLSQASNPIVSTAYVESDSLVYMSEPHHSVLVKQEPLSSDFIDTVSNHSETFSTTTGQLFQDDTPPSSLDSLDQSHLKLERKRARNRVAARRCRERKISLIRSLENQVAERDAQVKQLEEMLARYRSEGERLRVHMEILSNSYPSLKADLCQFPFLFQQRPLTATNTSKLPVSRSPTPLHVDLSELVSSKHFS
ncbi:hypothetical protein CSKR_112901 [Clonorchis sinensis]|uniref:Uncharacterized protein n=2 Tax=Clonorchis sinensis TaxID=79923 RepID=A0A8T1M6G4_CLOSI|nr:hypothetical protein CSKR_112901 [Clonorchis sinensis]GAA36516.2 jun-related protein [Clonorchis sinensis]